MENLSTAAVTDVANWLEMAEAHIDARFGEGFARKNPALVGAFLQATAAQLGNHLVQDEIAQQLGGIAASLRDVRDSIASR
jgi:hypothetical protein